MNSISNLKADILASSGYLYTKVCGRIFLQLQMQLYIYYDTQSTLNSKTTDTHSNMRQQTALYSYLLRYINGGISLLINGLL